MLQRTQSPNYHANNAIPSLVETLQRVDETLRIDDIEEEIEEEIPEGNVKFFSLTTFSDQFPFLLRLDMRMH